MTRAERLYQAVNAVMSDPDRRDDPRSYIGLGNENIPGKPFQFAHNMERQAIRDHLRRRIWRFGFDNMRAERLEYRVTQIQNRLHRERPTYRERQAAWRARTAPPPPQGANPFLTWEELQHLVDLFTGANDPVSVEIARKATEALEKRP